MVPAYGTRNQEIDPRRFLTAGLVGSVDTDVFFVQQHCQFSQYTHSLITQSRTKVIFQYRKIDDAIVSLADHIRAAITDPSNPERTALTPSILALDPDRILYYVIDIEAPWYFKFLDGWMNTEFYQSGQLSPVRYEELKADPVDTVYRLAGDLGLNVRVGTVVTAVEDSKNKMTRKNVGVNGRGKLMLNDSHKTKIDQMASFYNLPNDVL